jgi:hypothetical protein
MLVIYEEPVRQIWSRSRKGRHFNRCALTIHSSGLCIYEEIAHGTYKHAWSASIADISYCTAEPYRRRLFSWIARTKQTNELECHVVLCKTSEHARCLAQSLAQIFYQSYQIKQQDTSTISMDCLLHCSVCHTIVQQLNKSRSEAMSIDVDYLGKELSDSKTNTDHYEQIEMHTPSVIARHSHEQDHSRATLNVDHRSIDYDETLTDDDSIQMLEYYHR